MGCFANRELTKRKVTGYSFGTPGYQFMVDALNVRDVFGNDVMAITRE